MGGDELIRYGGPEDRPEINSKYRVNAPYNILVGRSRREEIQKVLAEEAKNNSGMPTTTRQSVEEIFGQPQTPAESDGVLDIPSPQGALPVPSAPNASRAPKGPGILDLTVVPPLAGATPEAGAEAGAGGAAGTGVLAVPGSSTQPDHQTKPDGQAKANSERSDSEAILPVPSSANAQGGSLSTVTTRTQVNFADEFLMQNNLIRGYLTGELLSDFIAQERQVADIIERGVRGSSFDAKELETIDAIFKKRIEKLNELKEKVENRKITDENDLYSEHKKVDGRFMLDLAKVFERYSKRVQNPR